MKNLFRNLNDFIIKLILNSRSVFKSLEYKNGLKPQKLIIIQYPATGIF